MGTSVSPTRLSQPTEAPGAHSQVLLHTRWALLLLALCLGLIVTFAPMELLLNNFIPDDSFYAHKTALNMARGFGSTFDTINRTNGYHPLWVLLEVPVFWFFGGGGEGPLRAILALQAALWGLSAVFAFELLRKVGDLVAAAAASFCWIAFGVLTMMNGLETALYCAVLYGFLLAYLRTYELPQVAARGPLPLYAWLGLLMGLAFLGRTDSVFVIGFVALDLVVRLVRALGVRRAVAPLAGVAIPAGLIGGAYMLTNIFYFHGVMQVSGASKKIYSARIREDLWAQGQSRVGFYVDNFLWPIRDNNLPVALSVLSIPFVAAAMLWLYRKSRGADPLARVYLRLWPMWAGVLTLYSCYAVMYAGWFTRTPWYYVPASLHAGFVILVFLALLRRSDWARAAWPVAVWTVFYLLSQPITVRRLAAGALLVGAGLGAAYLPQTGFFRRRAEPARTAGWLDTVLLVGVVAASLYWQRGYVAFLLVAALATIAVQLFIVVFQHRTARVGVVVAACIGAALASFPLRYAVSRNMNLEVNYNYLLYRGALWLKENTLPSTLITAGSAGILGYFSERAVINTDGLINSYDYYHRYLKTGRTMEYLRRSDIFADVTSWDHGWALKNAYPNGYFLDTPEDLKTATFMEGASQRRFVAFLLDKADAGVLVSKVAGEPIPNGDFETGSLDHWRPEGDAFLTQPTYEDNSFARGYFPAKQNGRYWIGTFERRPRPKDAPGSVQGNEAVGTLTSDPFRLTGSRLSFRVGGGDLPGTRVDVLIDGRVAFTARGARVDTMRPVEFDIRPYAGKQAVIRIVDEEKGPWGVINADDFRLLP